MKLKKIYFLTIFILIFIVVFIFNFFPNNSKSDIYISFSTINYDSNGLVDSLNIYYLVESDFGKKEANKIATLPYDCSYPAAVFDNKKNCIYFSYREGTDKDQVYIFDCYTGKTKLFLDDFSLINSIAINNNGDLCVIGSLKNSNEFIPHIYNESQGLISLSIKQDMCYGFNFDYKSNNFVFACYQSDKQYEKLLEYNEANFLNIQHSDFNISNYIYTYKSDLMLQLETLTGNIPTLIYDKSGILCGQRDGFSMENMDFFYYSDKNKKQINIDSSIIGLINIWEESIICMATSSQSMGIYCYESTKKTFTKCLFNTSNEKIQSAYIIDRK